MSRIYSNNNAHRRLRSMMALQNPLTVLLALGYLTLSSLSFAADDSSDTATELSSSECESGFMGIPEDILLYAILPHIDAPSVMHVAQVNHALKQAILGLEAGAQMLWLGLLVTDFYDRYPHTELKVTVHVDELMKRLPKTNQFLDTLREVHKLKEQGMLTELAYTAMVHSIKSPALQAQFIRLQKDQAQKAQSLSWCHANAERVAYLAWFLSLLGGTVMEVVGSSRLPSAEGIALVAVGGVILVITIGSTFWYMCLSSQGTVFKGWGQHMTRMAKHRVDRSAARSHEVHIKIEQLDHQN